MRAHQAASLSSWTTGGPAAGTCWIGEYSRHLVITLDLIRSTASRAITAATKPNQTKLAVARSAAVTNECTTAVRPSLGAISVLCSQLY